MKHPLLIIFIFITVSCTVAQLPDHNTYLIANLDQHNTYSALWGYTSPEGRLYAILGCDSGTAFVDLTDSSNVHEVDFVSGVPSLYREMKTYSHYAYVVSEGTNSRLQIIDLQYLPDSVSLSTTFSFSGYTKSHAISQSGPYLYLSGSNSPNQGVQILDLSDPIEPIAKGNFNTLYVHDCRINNDTVWACNILNHRVTIISAIDKDSPYQINSFFTPNGAPHNCALSRDRNYVYITHENLDPGKLDIYDVQDLSDITYVGDWQPTGITTSVTHNIEVYGDYGIIAHYTAGVRILDLKNPALPVEIAWFDTRPQDNSTSYEGCWAVYMFPNGKIIASDISNGLFVIKSTVITGVNKFSNTEVINNYSLRQNYPNPFNPSTSIDFQLEKSGNISLKIYDARGRLVSTLINGFRTAGDHSVKFNALNLPSGIYFYELVAKDFSKVMKMVVLK
ncbi:MAG: choice-of-anchor B family protein [Ignavibacteria bacterium]